MKFKDYKYERPNIDAFVKKGEELVENIIASENILDLEKYIDEFLTMTGHIETMDSLCSVRNSINTKDEFYDKEQEFFSENSPSVSNIETKFEKALVNHKLRRELENKYGKYWFKKMEMSLKTFSEEIMQDLVVESKLSQEYDKLIAGAEIEYDGKVYNLSQMSKFGQSLDREVRKNASIAVDNFFMANSKAIDDIYDGLVKVRDKIAKKLGFKNYVELGYYRLGRTDYNSEDVKEYRKQVFKELVPVANEIRRKQATRIGIDDPEMFDFSLEYLDGNPTPHGTKDELVLKAKKMYEEMSNETNEFFNFMLDGELMDLETKPGKMGGGYCTSFSDYNAPFIFANFNGTKGDVDVLTHEAGHAFQCYYASKFIKNPRLIWPTLEACEIHSMSMEFFAYPWINLFFEKDTNKYFHSHISEALTFIPYAVCVDEFQHFVYENPDVTPKERKEKWRELEKKYLPYRKYTYQKCFDEGTYWYRQGHIFGSPFYYIDYTLAQVCALQFYLASKKDYKEAWNRYISLCKLGGSMPFTDLIKEVGLENPFKDGTIKKITEELLPIINKIEL